MSGPNSPDLVLLSFVFPDDTLKSIALDASVHEQHSGQADVTLHQVEKGSNITDHIRPLPDKLTLEAFITNTPLGTPPSDDADTSTAESKKIDWSINNQQGSFSGLEFSDEFDRVRSAYELLVRAKNEGALFRIITTLATYKQMAMTSIGVPRDADHGNSIQFSMDFQSLRFVETQTTDALEVPKAAKKRKGNTPPKPPERKIDEKERSLWHAIVGAVAK